MTKNTIAASMVICLDTSHTIDPVTVRIWKLRIPDGDVRCFTHYPSETTLTTINRMLDESSLDRHIVITKTKIHITLCRPEAFINKLTNAERYEEEPECTTTQ